MASVAALLSSLAILFLFCSPSSANEGNILVSGDVLNTDEQLSAENSVFVIQDDCNLVLYNKAMSFESNTSGLSTKCTLTLSNYGQLIITDVITKKALWSSPRAKGYSMGQYAAILQPDGEVGIYGPAVWSTPRLASKEYTKGGVVNKRSDDVPSAADKRFDDAPSAADKRFDNAPSAANLLFSSEVLKEGSKVVSRDYALEVTKQGNLHFTKSASGTVVWASPNVLGRENCFARLNFHGQLALLDDNSKVLWHTKAAVEEGLYVLVVKIDGQAAIYGPRFWSTAA